MANKMHFVVEYGMLQARDLNPSIAGISTRDLTNPRLEEDEDVKQEIITGQATKQTSPMKYILIAAVILFFISYFQK